MSVEAQQLERSALERKDRDELHTIAVAMGGKPGSRARKADIVDLIMELAGVGPAPAGGDTTAPVDEVKPKKRAPRTKAADPADAAVPTADAIDPNAAPVEAQPVDAQPVGEAQGEASTETAGTRRNGEGRSPRPDRDQNQGGQGNRDRDQHQGGQGNRDRDQNRGGPGNQDRDQVQGNRNRDQGNRDQGNQDQGNQDQGNQNQGNQNQGADGEPGNRRRRRRGRDRDRPEAAPEFQGEPVDVAGMLDLRDEGYGFLRVKGYLPSKDDVYVSVKQVRQFGLRKGDHLTGASRPASRNEKNPALLRIDLVNGQDPEVARTRPRFEDLTPLFPDTKLRLETTDDPTNMTARIIDLVSPIGKGQRGLIVSPPKAGKTTIMKQIARSIESNDPEVHLMVLLVDERPEEVTDMRRWVKGEVVASTFDRPADEHTMVAELTIERAKRLVEEGKDVVIILDGITRLARAYNLAAPATGRIMSGGIDTGALYPPKKFFGAARNIEEGGSLTILATALIETGSKMDEVIFEEFKGTGNMELRLDRRMAERRIYPAIDVDGSSTRHEELLFDRKQLQMVWKLRRVLSALAAEGNSGAGLEMLIDRLATFKSNDEFLAEVAKTPTAGV
jgi:transcription termination factor Rho